MARTPEMECGLHPHTFIHSHRPPPGVIIRRATRDRRWTVQLIANQRRQWACVTRRRTDKLSIARPRRWIRPALNLISRRPDAQSTDRPVFLLGRARELGVNTYVRVCLFVRSLRAAMFGCRLDGPNNALHHIYSVDFCSAGWGARVSCVGVHRIMHAWAYYVYRQRKGQGSAPWVAAQLAIELPNCLLVENFDAWSGWRLGSRNS